MTMIHAVGIKTATHSDLGAVKTVLQSLKDHCIHPKTGKPYILDLRAGKQVSTDRRFGQGHAGCVCNGI
ncbi:hypothetical protein C367_06424 [Cryptococcus neoformans Ze90-1]|nr:hypothetical protein C367_06424 [Cryptococcus neoformans var. grubii Ze90-1]